MNEPDHNPDPESPSRGWIITYAIVLIYLAAFIGCLHLITQQYASAAP